MIKIIKILTYKNPLWARDYVINKESIKASLFKIKVLFLHFPNNANNIS